MKHSEFKKELLALTKVYAGRADQIQGPGGNTSVKDFNGNMFIKASGMRFEELTLTHGISAVKHTEIAHFLSTYTRSVKHSDEKELIRIVQNNILLDENDVLYPKPSMETGFHAVLKRYVVHTHSVWTNLINCTQEQNETIEKLKNETGLNISYLPFISPGFELSYEVNQALKTNNFDVLFLGNHGIIGHGDDADKVIEILYTTDQGIQKILNLDRTFPNTELNEITPNKWAPKDGFCIQILNLYSIHTEFFNLVLFPDQTVFFEGQINDDPQKINKINFFNNELFYNCGKREAISIHETMTAYLFIYNHLSKLGIQPKGINSQEIDYINNMEMEKHRKKLM